MVLGTGCGLVRFGSSELLRWKQTRKSLTIRERSLRPDLQHYCTRTSVTPVIDREFMSRLGLLRLGFLTETLEKTQVLVQYGFRCSRNAKIIVSVFKENQWNPTHKIGRIWFLYFAYVKVKNLRVFCIYSRSRYLLQYKPIKSRNLQTSIYVLNRYKTYLR